MKREIYVLQVNGHAVALVDDESIDMARATFTRLARDEVREIRPTSARACSQGDESDLEAPSLDVIADRGYFNSGEILACDEAGITVTLPKPMTSNSKAEGRFGKQDFRYLADEDV